MSKVGRSCTVCAHRERASIDLALARGVSVNALAKRSGLHHDALYRHSRNHLPAQLRAKLIAGPSLDGIDLDKLRETESQSLLLHLVSLRHRLFASLDTAKEFGDGHMLSTLASQLHRNMELVGKLLGDLNVGGTHVTNNVLLLPSYVSLRHALVDALAAFPEARRAVAAVLHKIEGDAAEAMRVDTRQIAGTIQRPAPVTIEATPGPVVSNATPASPTVHRWTVADPPTEPAAPFPPLPPLPPC
jgi:hypothetical protein